MKILRPNTGTKTVQIPKFDIYVYVTDFGAKFLLKEIRVAPAQHTWHWIKMKEREEIDVSMMGDHVCSFEKAINMAVNNAYATVYQFSDYNEVFDNWQKIKYENNITTSYEASE